MHRPQCSHMAWPEPDTGGERFRPGFAAQGTMRLSKPHLQPGDIATFEKENTMLRKTQSPIVSYRMKPYTRVVAGLHSRSTFGIFATCLMFLLFAHLPANADHVHQLYYNNAGWVDTDITKMIGGGIASSESAITALYTPGPQLHVYYIDTKLHVRQLYFNGKSWIDEDLTAATGGPQAGIWGITSFAIGNLQHVFYVGYGDSHVHELYYNNAGWSDQDITAAAGGASANLVAPEMVGFATKPNNQFHIYYEDSNLHMHQLYFNGISWIDEDLTAQTGASCYPGTQFPPAGAGYITGFAVGNLQHLFCAGVVSGHIHLLHIHYNNAIWTSEDITAKVGGGALSFTSAVAAFSLGHLEVYGVTFDNHVHQFTSINNKWSDLDLTASHGAPSDFWYGGAVAFPTKPNNQFHIYYQPGTEVYQLYFNGTNWTSQDLTGGAGQADYYGSGMAGFAIGNLQHVFYLGYGS